MENYTNTYEKQNLNNLLVELWLKLIFEDEN